MDQRISVDNQDLHYHKEGANVVGVVSPYLHIFGERYDSTETQGDTAKKKKLSRRRKTCDASVGCRHSKL
jgi:hypothetical protein